MRQSIGGTWITGLVISFTFIFAAFLALSINYSKAFRVKNEVLSIIEKNGGITKDSLTIISNYLTNNGYTLRGECGSNYAYGVRINGVNNNNIRKASKNGKYSFCVSKIKKKSYNAPNFQKRAHYEIKLFFKFNLPVLGDIFTFDVKGQTKDVTYPLDADMIEESER